MDGMEFFQEEKQDDCLEWTAGEELNLSKKVEDEMVDFVKISRHAIIESPNPKTMKLLGWIRNQSVVILLYTGSTHNFMDTSMVNKENKHI
jgi:hypothetical protein